jgi:DNA-binding NtrC family response regulator
VVIMKKRVLVVDDDERILRAFAKILKAAEYAVETAKTAREAAEKLKRKRYDAVLIDIKLPDGEGIDLMSKIPETSNTAKIIVTGYSSVEYGEKSAEYGADDFLVKPVEPVELLDVLRRLIGEA